MKTSIDKIKNIIFSEKQISPHQLRVKLNISQVLIHRHLKKLCENKIIEKIGSPPKVFYRPIKNIKNIEKTKLSQIVENNWLEILPNGRFVYGMKGFEIWCRTRNFDFEQKIKDYEQIFIDKEKLKTNNLFDATSKITTTFKTNYLEKLWYVDFYSWEIFGKTKLGKLILYAKQNSDIILMKQITDIINKPIYSLIKQENFDLIGRVPHSVPRKKDFLKTTLAFTNIKSKQLFDKVFVGHSVAQKTLKSKKEREQNAEETLFLKIDNFPPKILLIDDACGSGSTLNISAQKIKEKSPKTKIFGITFVGSFKGFEVIAES